MVELRKYHLLRGWLGDITYFVSTIVFGTVAAELIEFPVLHLRDRIFPREAGDAVRISMVRSETPIACVTIATAATQVHDVTSGNSGPRSRSMPRDRVRRIIARAWPSPPALPRVAAFRRSKKSSR